MSRTRERCFTPEGMKEDIKAQTNSGTRNRSTSRVTMNRDRIICYKCREYDHFANECPHSVMDDSEGYESYRAALQLITTDAEIHQNSEGTRSIKEQDYLNI